ncbi:MAG: hypothetical protein AUI15_35205 [Actinobacteria bacterium 13_2_20CM_2_66_6]|nr:MAG: hypothetical protein AUI15_35205 [Actinobacteria bacterium 13_2_20CM_2_66_6]
MTPAASGSRARRHAWIVNAARSAKFASSPTIPVVAATWRIQSCADVFVVFMPAIANHSAC